MNIHWCSYYDFTVLGGGMHDYSFYSAILGLPANWRIVGETIDERSGDIELHIRSNKGSKFSCSTCGALNLPSGVSKARWLHENHLNIRFYISALIPVITCEHCGEMKIDIPWKQTGSRSDEDRQLDSEHEEKKTPLKLF